VIMLNAAAEVFAGPAAVDPDPFSPVGVENVPKTVRYVRLLGNFAPYVILKPCLAGRGCCWARDDRAAPRVHASRRPTSHVDPPGKELHWRCGPRVRIYCRCGPHRQLPGGVNDAPPWAKCG
jgi:hypothetical protein